MGLTGRLFKCISIKGVETEQVSKYFKIGEVYNECDVDIFGNNDSDDNALLLYSKTEIIMMNENSIPEMVTGSFYVSLRDFEQVAVFPKDCLN